MILEYLRCNATSRESAILSINQRVRNFRIDLAEIQKDFNNETCDCCKERIYLKYHKLLAKTEPWVKAIYRNEKTAEEVWDRFLELHKADRDFWNSFNKGA